MKDAITAEQKSYMRLALKLAEKGTGLVAPNPLVGAVIVKDGEIIGEGWHPVYAGIHAERHALQNCLERGEDPRGADIYVTLEPCCHQGKNPPCTDAMIEAGIKRVFVGATDPNPKVAGKGLEILRSHGIEVIEHVMEKECMELNAGFIHYMTTGKPLVYLKSIMTMDGKSTYSKGNAHKLLDMKARHHIYMMRNKCDAVMTGVGTIVSSDPSFYCAVKGGRNPIRVICDTNLKTPLTSKVVKTARQTPLIIATCQQDEDKLVPYKEAGAEIMIVHETDGHGDMNEIIQKLGEKRIVSVVLETSSEMSWAALDAGIVNRTLTYVTPQFLGGMDAKTPIGGSGFIDAGEAIKIRNVKVRKLGNDYLFEGEIGTDCDNEGNT